MNYMVFSTGGNWESTTLHNNGDELPAEELYLELRAGRDAYDEPCHGGIGLGGEMTAYVRPQDNPGVEASIFPGRLELNFPGHSLIIENSHPMFAFEFTHLWYNGRDVTRDVMDVMVQINAPENIVRAGITLYRPHWIVSDEVASIALI